MISFVSFFSFISEGRKTLISFVSLISLFSFVSMEEKDVSFVCSAIFGGETLLALLASLGDFDDFVDDAVKDCFAVGLACA